MRTPRNLILGLCLAWVLFPACGKDDVSEPNINELLQGTNGRWELYKKFTDTDGTQVELTYVLIFRSPHGYRWKEFGRRDGEEDTDLYHEENGTYELTESSPKKGTITFIPEVGDQWEVSFEILTGSGDLLVTKPDGQQIQFEYIRSTLGISY